MNENGLGVLAGRWVLAVDSGDPRELTAVMRDVVASDGGNFGFLVALAGTVRGFAQQVEGEHWRSVLSTELHLLDIDGLDADEGRGSE
jgi:hypothetical protein